MAYAYSSAGTRRIGVTQDEVEIIQQCVCMITTSTLDYANGMIDRESCSVLWPSAHKSASSR